MTHSFKTTISPRTAYVLLIAWVTVTLCLGVGLAMVASAETTEMANESVTFDNASNLTVAVDWNESIDDVDNASASVTVYNGTEYDDDPANATEVLTDEIAAQEGNTTETTYTDADGLADGEQYRVLVTADDTEADAVTVDDGTVGGGWFGGTDGSGSPLLGLAIIVASLGVAWWVTGGD